jgi:hypothetical protein
MTKIRLVDKTIDNKGNRILKTVHTTKYLFGLIIKLEYKTYKSTRIIVEGYWNWVEMPNHTLVNDTLSFQLDEWARSDYYP